MPKAQAVLRFYPGFVYSRCRSTHQLPGSVQTVVESAVVAANNATNDDSRQQFSSPQESHKHCHNLSYRSQRTVPAHHNVAKRPWQQRVGDTQARARQVLIKKLAILNREGISFDDLLLRYFSLFKGLLTDGVVKALMALCGLDAAAAAPTAQA